MKYGEIILRNPGITSALLSCVTNIVLTIIEFYSDIHSLSELGKYIAVAFLAPFMMMILTYPIGIVIATFWVFSYGYSWNNRQHRYLRVVASALAGQYGIILVRRILRFMIDNE